MLDVNCQSKMASRNNPRNPSINGSIPRASRAKKAAQFVKKSFEVSDWSWKTFGVAKRENTSIKIASNCVLSGMPAIFQ